MAAGAGVPYGRVREYLIEAVGNSAALLGTAADEMPYQRAAVLGWLETDLLHLEALTGEADGWRWEVQGD